MVLPQEIQDVLQKTHVREDNQELIQEPPMIQVLDLV